MARSGSFGHNPLLDYGSSQSIPPFGAGVIFSDPRGLWISFITSSAIAQYDCVTLTPDATLIMKGASQTTTTAGSSNLMCGFAQVAYASGSLALAWIGGAGGGGFGSGIKGKVAASYPALALLNTTATPGVSNNASTTLIKNVVGLTTDSGSGSAVELYSSGAICVN